MVVLCLAAAVVVLGGLGIAVGASSGGGKNPVAAASTPASSTSSTPSAGSGDVPHSITVPKSVGDYTQLTGSIADRLAQSMRKSMGETSGKYAAVYAKAKIAIYGKQGDVQRPLVFVGLSGSDSPELGTELRSSPPSDEVDSTFLGMGIGDAKDYPAGPLGGVLRCGKGQIATGTAAACAWADSSTVGVVMTPTVSDVTALARTTLDLRNAAEH
jgi:hypothetical protein